MSVAERDAAQRLLQAAGKNIRAGHLESFLQALEENRCDALTRIGLAGIPLSSPLGQQLLRLVPALPPISLEEEEAVDLRPWEEGELLVMNSRFKQCGIREYGDALNAQLSLLGATVRATRLQDLSVLASAKGDILLHVEPALLPQNFDAVVKKAFEGGARVVLCAHSFTEKLLRRFQDIVSAVAVHRDYGLRHPKLRQIPLGCPLYEPSSSVQELRKKYNLPEGATIITTFGFLTAWKRFPETARTLLPLLEPGMFLQMLCSPHFVRYEEGERQLQAIIDGASGLAVFPNRFLSQEEAMERTYASDLGFLFHGENTGSVSAASKHFVSARCPLVVTSSNHASDMPAASRPSAPGLEAFVKHVVSVAKDKRGLQALKSGAEKEYQRLNMRRVAEEYLKLFATLKEQA